jgi:hypothetical protein
MEEKRRNRTILAAVVSVILLAGILVGGMFLLTGSAHKDASEAAKSVSHLYLDELAGRREQVVEDNLNNNVNVINVAIRMLTDEDLSDLDHMLSYQRKVKKLFNLERFAFVDEEGNIYTADEGVRKEADQYPVDLVHLSDTGIFIRNKEAADK